MYLLDTNVISELRRPKPHGGVVAWIVSTPDSDLHLAAITLGELQAGVEITRERDTAKATEIEAWIDQVAMTFNILDMDARTFRRWAQLMHHKSDDHMVDGLIAATASVHNLIVVTRNVRDFATFDVNIFDPFSGTALHTP
jgi:predicted nucleic acid-binding protein